MNPIQLPPKRADELEQMIKALFPENEWVKVHKSEGMVSGSKIYGIHWFEFCIIHLIPKVAEALATQPSITKGYATFIVTQKVINDLPNKNPIDNLYDMWKYPSRYNMDL